MKIKKTWNDAEIEKLKSDKSLRDKLRAEIEKRVEIGKPKFYSVDTDEFWYRINSRVATEDKIRQFCNAIGDANPLYRNQDYARDSVHGSIIAPPSFLNAVSVFMWKAGYDFLPPGLDVGAEAEWFKVIRVNDEFRVHESATRVVDLTRDHTGLQFLLSAEKVYKNQRDEVVAIVRSNVMDMISSSTKEPKSLQPAMHCFSEEEIKDWLHLIEKEEIRGNVPRFWEDVKIGEQLQPTHHVFSIVESASFMAVCGLLRSWRFEMTCRGRGDWNSELDENSGLPDFGSIHLSDGVARRHNLPRIACFAGQMQTWLCQMITNWMGDAGFLKKISVQVKRPLYGDSLALCTGTVKSKYISGSDHMVDLDIALEDHDGNKQIPNGTATVILPSRSLTTAASSG